MELTFQNPGVDYMLTQIMEFQADDETGFWAEPLYHFYPQLNQTFAMSLPFPERKAYIEKTLRTVYTDLEDTINDKVRLYTHHWASCKEQITAALSDAFDVDCSVFIQ